MNNNQGNNNNIKSYWCTWSTQDFLAKKYLTSKDGEVPLDTDGAKLARNMLNEKSIFGKNGMAYQFTEDIRRDIYFMLDDGWDVDYDIHPDKNANRFGSHIVSTMRFPFANGTPEQRLKIMNEKIKDAGWKGIGIWVCAQKEGEDYQQPFTKDDESYWIDRINWSKYAGVEYWKVDWGFYQEDLVWRRRLTELAREIYPSLTIEHAISIGPLNTKDPWKYQSGRFSDMGIQYEKSLEAIEFSEVFRSYDVLKQLSTPTTLDRISTELKSAKGYINSEDEVYMGAVLGTQLGIMRSYIQGDCMDEVVCSIRWQRICPPFIGTNLFTSNRVLEDNYTFENNETWFGGVSGKNTIQSAPGIVSRNTPLPTVKGDVVPYVLASKNGNAYSIGTFKRTSNRNYYYPLVDIECLAQDVEYIGVFGRYSTITFTLDRKPKSIYAMSLLDNTSIDITNMATIKGNSFRIDSSIQSLMFNSKDGSEPSFALHILH